MVVAMIYFVQVVAMEMGMGAMDIGLQDEHPVEGQGLLVATDWLKGLCSNLVVVVVVVAVAVVVVVDGDDDGGGGNNDADSGVGVLAEHVVAAALETDVVSVVLVVVLGGDA